MAEDRKTETDFAVDDLEDSFCPGCVLYNYRGVRCGLMLRYRRDRDFPYEWRFRVVAKGRGLSERLLCDDYLTTQRVPV